MPSYTYDPATTAGRVRLLVTDTNVGEPELVVFSDEEVAAFLALEGDDVYLAAAAALEAIAASEVLIQKRITILERSTDGPAEARELRAIAASYRERADTLALEVDGEDAGFAVAEFVLDGFTYDERLRKEALRDA